MQRLFRSSPGLRSEATPARKRKNFVFSITIRKRKTAARKTAIVSSAICQFPKAYSHTESTAITQLEACGLTVRFLPHARKGIEFIRAHPECRAADLLAAIGPGIGPCCFETHDDVPRAMAARWGHAAEPFCVPNGKGKFHVDLKGLIRWEMAGAGVAPDHIETLDLCTGCRPELYWSHRKLGDRRGNHGAMIQLL